jgi:hypothetical protein
VNPETAVITNPAVALVGFLGVIVLLLFLIAKWRWHVFLALLVPLILFGIIPGVASKFFSVCRSIMCPPAQRCGSTVLRHTDPSVLVR